MNKSTKKSSGSVLDPTRSLSIVRQESRLIATLNPDKDSNEFDPDRDYSLVIKSTQDKHSFDVYTELSGNVGLLEGSVYEKPVYAILGAISLFSTSYLILVTERSTVGTLMGKHNVFCIKKVELLPINLQTPTQEEQQYIDTLLTLLDSGSFYYSLSYDLSHTLERQHGLKDKKPQLLTGKALWEHLDERFIWNQLLAAKFHSVLDQFANFIPPIIQGFVSINNDCIVEGNSNKRFGFALISRRNKRRAGTRYHTRGADPDGNTAAYVETEQIVHIPESNTVTSFVQIRGSIPLLWKQDINLAYEPPIDIDVHKSDSTVKLHFEEQLQFYKKQVLINLVKEKGAEGPLGAAYAKAMEVYNNKNVKYVGFDVYKYCKQTDFSKLSILVEQIKDDFQEMGYFKMEGNEVKRLQLGVFRTNCKDCLDRTNLVQGLFARLNIIEQLTDFGMIKSEEDLNNSKFMTVFRHAWADNGDAISIIYAGTPALKADVTRTGKRSYQGMIDDGFNAITRYYINNFQDGMRQDAMDLLLGNVMTPIQKVSRSEQVTYFVAILLTLMSIFGPGAVKYRLQMIIIAVIMLWIIITSKILRVKGRHVVNTPQLTRAKQKMG